MTLTKHLKDAAASLILVPALFLIWPIPVGYWGIHVLWNSVFEDGAA